MARHPGSSNPCNSGSKLHRLASKSPLVLGHRALHGLGQPVSPRPARCYSACATVAAWPPQVVMVLLLSPLCRMTTGGKLQMDSGTPRINSFSGIKETSRTHGPELCGSLPRSRRRCGSAATWRMDGEGRCQPSTLRSRRDTRQRFQKLGCGLRHSAPVLLSLVRRRTRAPVLLLSFLYRSA